MDEPRQVTTACPRCSAPIRWSLQLTASGEPLNMAVWSCACPLTEHEWLAFAEEALLELEDSEVSAGWAGDVGRRIAG